MNDAEDRAIVGIITVAFGVAFLIGSTVHAHRAATSPYSYNEHVFPILRDHCGRCHVEGGAAPMSLLSYQDTSGGAFAWAQSIREMLVSEAMPPWYADATGPAVEHAHALSSRDLDIIVTWASGGAPEGDPPRRPAPVTAHAQWALGKPDLVLAMPTAHEVGPNTTEETFDVTLPTNLKAARWVKAVDLLPGTPTMVRRAQIKVVDGPVLAVWEPGDEVPLTPEGEAFQVPAGAKLHLQVFYKKSWQEEHHPKTDRSTIGLYFTRPPTSGGGIGALVMSGPRMEGNAPVSFSGMMGRPGRVLAVRVQLDRPYASMAITAVTESGRRVPLLKLRSARPEWPRRYWLHEPVELPGGTKIEVTGTPNDSDSSPPAKAVELPLEVALDFVTK